MAGGPTEVSLHQCMQHRQQQEELEAILLQESYDVVAITETWWDKSYDWSVAIDGYKLFRRDRRERRGGGVALYVKKWLECEELLLKNSCEQVKSLWVGIRDWDNKGSLVVGVYYRGLTTWSLLMMHSYSSLRRHHDHRLSSCWGILTTLTSVGKATRLAAGTPGSS
ncbi:hypothetical protein llap_18546 [Limosa lapponica baueri]|uniref:Endonuclease/exonuclease/phosphatase domain-containing protein n=1 Tax=Limosa lapponica baueri TaxID=1758121 RepID=A0A2I0TBG7_LIMLA|nr:hypothetical protein llap_18546 [Limosa lapponica baueri]